MQKKIVQYWQGKKTSELSKLMDSWQSLNPDWEYEVFDRAAALLYLYKNHDSRVLRAFIKAKLPAMQSDIFRVAWCLKEGGVYVDASTECLQPMNYLDVKSGLALMRKWHGGVCNGFIYANPSHPILVKVLEKIVENVENETFDDVWKATGPGVWSQFVKDEPHVDILDQSFLKDFFKIFNELEHKKNHWSKVQKKTRIYNVPPTDSYLKSIVLHLGPHKTATTTVQNFIAKNESDFEENGYGVMTVRSKNGTRYAKARDSYTRALQTYLLSSCDVTAREKAVKEMSLGLKEMLGISQGGPANLILSDENILGPVVGHKFAKNHIAFEVYGAISVVIESIKNATAGCDVKVILCRRPFESWLLSCFKDLVSKMKELVTPEDYVSRISSEACEQYDALFFDFKKAFSDVHILDFEELESSGTSGFLKEFLSAIDKSLSTTISSDGNYFTNKGFSLGIVEYLIKNFDSKSKSNEKNDLLARFDKDSKEYPTRRFLKEISANFGVAT